MLFITQGFPLRLLGQAGPAGSQTCKISKHALTYVLRNAECVDLWPSQEFSKGQPAT